MTAIPPVQRHIKGPLGAIWLRSLLREVHPKFYSEGQGD